MTLTRSGLSTLEVQQLYASSLSLPSHKDVGASGLKDKHAVATQTFSVPHYSKGLGRKLTESEVREASPGTVLDAAECSKKIRRNYHTSNEFVVVLRGCTPPPGSSLPSAISAVVAGLRAAGGVRNYYGPQRFGSRCSGAYRGHAILEEVKGKEGKKAKKAANNAR